MHSRLIARFWGYLRQHTKSLTIAHFFLSWPECVFCNAETFPVLPAWSKLVTNDDPVVKGRQIYRSKERIEMMNVRAVLYQKIYHGVMGTARCVG